MSSADAGAGPWAVATPHYEATQAAEHVLADGGNAVDAALAAAAVLTVVYPNQCSIGGDCIALVGLPDGTVHAVGGIGRTPTAFNRGDLDAATRMPIDGPLTVTVPGVVAGWSKLAEAWGTRDLAAALRPAAALARDGVVVSPGLGRALTEQAERIRRDEGLRQVFAPEGTLLSTGARLVQPALAASLTAIAQHGADEFYRGRIGSDLVACLRQLGSRMSLDDLAAHRTTIAEPISWTYSDEEYFVAPPPSQGVFFLESLAALEAVRVEADRALDVDATDTTLVARVLQQTSDDRDRLLGDPDVSPVDIHGLLTTRAHEIAADTSRRAPSVPNPTPTGDTVAIVATDGSGTWASLIQSVFHSFGSGILDPATGIVLHSRGASFSLEPGHPGEIGPARRPPHTLMPVLVRRDGRLVGAHGTMGGRAQAQIHTQLALRLAAGQSPTNAIKHPRWILGNSEVAGTGHTTAHVEADVKAPARQGLQAVFEVADLQARDDEAGHAQLIRLTSAGDLAGGSDPRSDGAYSSSGAPSPGPSERQP